MNIFTAPLFALYNVDFYRTVIRSRLTKGFLYVAFLAVVGTVLFATTLVGRLFPQADAFVDWFKQGMPGLVWTPDGLTMDIQGPYTMNHPVLGGVVTFDPAPKDVKTSELGPVLIYVTPDRLYLRQGVNEVRVIELAQPAASRRGTPQVVKIDAALIAKFYGAAKPWIVSLTVVFFFVSFYAWKLLAALFFSWIGLLLNFRRREKLTYGAIFHVSLFALTATTLLQFLNLIFPALNRIPFGLPGTLVVTTVYLYVGICKTEPPASDGAAA